MLNPTIPWDSAKFFRLGQHLVSDELAQQEMLAVRIPVPAFELDEMGHLGHSLQGRVVEAGG